MGRDLLVEEVPISLAPPVGRDIEHGLVMAVDVDVPAAVVFDPCKSRQVVHEQHKLLFTFPEGLLRLLSGRDVSKEGEEPAAVTIYVSDAHLHIEDGAVLGSMAGFEPIA